ncbi:MAG: STAS domain-containing protein [Pseudomonadota bacterium]
MNIKIQSLGGVKVLHCDGSLDADTVEAFKEVSYKLINEGTNNFVIDCTEVQFVDSIGLGALISLLRRVREKEGDVKISSLNEDVKTIFEITRLHRLFEISADWKTAAKSFNR